MRTIIFFSILLAIFSCNSTEECENSIYPFESLTSSLLQNSDFEKQVNMDAPVHEYSFIMQKNGYICSIGYQSLNTNSIYRISILDKNFNEIFVENMSFDSSNVDHQNIEEIEIVANEQYIIRRIITNPKTLNELCGQNINKVIGYDGIFQPIDFPISNDLISITSGKYFGVDSLFKPLDSSNIPIDRLIPYIDFGFVPN